MIDTDRMTPKTYAARLAGYIRDPSRVRVYTLREYGRAPSLAECRRLIQDRAPKPVRGRYEMPFECGHPRVEANIYEHESGKEQCATCREKRLAADAIKRAERDRAKAAKAAARKGLAFKLAPIETDIAFSGDVIKYVADRFKIKPADIIGKNRSQGFVCARAVVAYALRQRGKSYPWIGRLLNRDHSTIINLVDTFEDRAKRNPIMLTVAERLAS